MKNPLYRLCMALLFAGCHSSPGPLGPYRNVGKWIIPTGNYRRPLLDHPKTITEYNYPAGDSTRPEVRHLRYQKYTFNADGDLTFQDTYLRDSLLVRVKNSYDGNGFQSASYDASSGHATTVVTRPLGDGRFKTVTDNPMAGFAATISSFTADGKEVIRDNYRDSAATGEPDHVELLYDGRRCTRISTRTKARRMEERFFYSRWDTPDSMLIYTKGMFGNKLMGRDYYTYNEHGDPQELIFVAGKDMMTHEVYRYVYDQHGNWTRRIMITLGNKYNAATGASMMDRVIEY